MVYATSGNLNSDRASSPVWVSPPKDAPVCPPAGRLHDDIAASSTEGAVLTSKVNRFGKWSTASENSKPIAGINANNGQPKCKRIRDASIYTSKKYRSSFYSWAIFFCFHLSGSNSRYLLNGVLGGSAAALFITSDIYSKKLIPCSLHEHASE